MWNVLLSEAAVQRWLLLYCGMRYVLFLLQLIWPRRLYLAGDIANLCSFIQGLLEWPFSKLFSSDELLRNQYKYIAFKIFSCRILIILHKVLIITGISDETRMNESYIYIWILKTIYIVIFFSYILYILYHMFII